MLIDPGSYRDNAGVVLHVDGRILRAVRPAGARDFTQTRDSGVLDLLVRKGMLLPFTEIDPSVLHGRFAGEISHLLEHPKLEFISYPYEWPFAALKCAALLHLDIHLLALENGLTLRDATAYNVQFDGATPVFIDHLSFRPYKEGEYWQGHRQFCEQFLYPLLLCAIGGLHHHAWYRASMAGIPGEDLDRVLPWYRKLAPLVFTHLALPAWLQRKSGRQSQNEMPARRLPLSAYLHMLKGLRRGIEQLEAPPVSSSVWTEYADNTVYRPEETAAKKQFIQSYVCQAKPQIVWDFGCNTGAYAMACLESGARTVIGFDTDPGALELACQRARENKLRLLPLFMDAANPSPSQGWRETERGGLSARSSPDGILALAFLHHLVIRNNVPMHDAVDWLINLAPTGVIEFVPKNDPMVQRLLALREDVFAEYESDTFIGCVTSKAAIVSQAVITPEGRLLVQYTRKITSPDTATGETAAARDS